MTKRKSKPMAGIDQLIDMELAKQTAAWRKESPPPSTIVQVVIVATMPLASMDEPELERTLSDLRSDGSAIAWAREVPIIAVSTEWKEVSL